MYKVVLTDYAWPDLNVEKEVLSKGGAELVATHCSTEAEVLRATAEADGVITEYAPITRQVLYAAKRCKVISLNAVGYDNVDVSATTEVGVVVANCPDYCYDEVSDHTIALLLACARRVVKFYQDVRNKVWDFKSAGKIERIRGLTLGLVGFGGISRAVAKKAKPFGLNIVAYDPFLPAEVFEKNEVQQTPFEELLRIADFISIHTPKTKQTVGLFSEGQFKMMKPNTYLINTSRGGIIDETALYWAIRDGVIAGAALDVLTKEPADFTNPLFTLENIIVTPHAAFYSEGAMIEVRKRAAEEVLRVLEGRWPENLVNRELRGRTDLRAGILR